MLWYIALAAFFFPGLLAALTFRFPFLARSPTADVLTGQPPIQEITMPEMVDCVRKSGPEKRYRFRYGYPFGVHVYGWPSTGGVYTLHDLRGVELDFLGYDRFNLPRDLVEPQPEEDAHCDRMRRLGAIWWERYEDLVEHLFTGLQAGDEVLKVGWPETGGVWVLHTTVDEAREKGVALVGNAYTMQERCMMIERLGGVFYADPYDCPYLDLPPVNSTRAAAAEAQSK